MHGGRLPRRRVLVAGAQAGRRVSERCELVAEAAGLDGQRVWVWARAFAASEAVLATDLPRARAHHFVIAG